MNPQSADMLENLLRCNGLEWMIDLYGPADKVIRGLLELLEQVSIEYETRFATSVSFSPESLVAEGERNPHKVKAFLQALGISNSAQMLVMVWRIAQGARIREVEMTYLERRNFSLVVRLAHADGVGERVDEYRSTDVNDASLIRHFGIATISGTPLFEGFYPLRVKDELCVNP